MSKINDKEILNRLEKIQKLCTKGLEIHGGNSIIIEISNEVLFLTEELKDEIKPKMVCKKCKKIIIYPYPIESDTGLCKKCFSGG